MVLTLDLLLASTSPYRRALLARLGLPFRVRAPLCDEESLKAAALSPRELAEHLAFAKADSLAWQEPQATIIGSDQLATFDGRILGKPGSFDAAVEQLLSMSGRPHQLITAFVVLHQAVARRHTDVATLQMRRLTRAEIERYVAADQPFDCAGAYKLEERGITLFERIESADHSAITGLPLIALTTTLRELGAWNSES
ncbi:MAG: nucleoside triphosphate pyrophosphatase [Pirellulales bacterium]